MTKKRKKLPQVLVDEDLHYQAKQVAARERITITALASRGLELVLQEYQANKSA